MKNRHINMQRTKKKTWKKIDEYPWQKKIYFIFYAGSKWPPLNRCPPAHTSNVHTQKCAHTHRKAFVPLCVVMQRPHCSTFSLPPLHGSSLPFISPSFENHFHRNFLFVFFANFLSSPHLSWRQISRLQTVERKMATNTAANYLKLQ